MTDLIFMVDSKVYRTYDKETFDAFRNIARNLQDETSSDVWGRDRYVAKMLVRDCVGCGDLEVVEVTGDYTFEKSCLFSIFTEAFLELDDTPALKDELLDD